jgi:hypothetical protein
VPYSPFVGSVASLEGTGAALMDPSGFRPGTKSKCREDRGFRELSSLRDSPIFYGTGRTTA